MADEQILTDFIAWLNGKYGWTLPVAQDFGPDSLLFAIWEKKVRIEKDPKKGLLFVATSLTTIELPPTRLSATVVLQVHDNRPPTLSFDAPPDGRGQFA